MYENEEIKGQGSEEETGKEEITPEVPETPEILDPITDPDTDM